VVGADRAPYGERLDGREAEAVNDQSAMQPGGQSEVAAVLGMMATACGRLASVEDKLGDVPLIQQTLESLMKGQEKVEGLIEKIEESHREAREQYRDQLHEHQLKIQAIELRLENYNTIVKLAYDTETTLQINSAVTGALVLALLAIAANGPAWWGILKPKTSTTTPTTILPWKAASSSSIWPPT
jgi:DNA repair exonuclease SbcCD ATPase subunit